MALSANNENKVVSLLLSPVPGYIYCDTPPAIFLTTSAIKLHSISAITPSTYRLVLSLATNNVIVLQVS